MDDQLQRFSLLLHQTAALWRNVLDRRLKPLGFSQASWRTLLVLTREPEACNQTRLADRLGIEAPTLVRLLDRMERQGWVKRLPDPLDRRSKRVEATAASLALVADISAAVAAVRQELLADLTPAELEGAIALLDGVRLRAEAALAAGGEIQA